MSDRLEGRALDLVAGPNVCVIATLMPDGTPQLSNVWTDVEEDGRLVVISYEGAVKVSNVRRDPRVVVQVVNVENQYETVSLTGKVIRERSDGGPEMIDRLALKYSGERYRGHHIARPWVILEIEPERVTYYWSDLYP